MSNTWNRRALLSSCLCVVATLGTNCFRMPAGDYFLYLDTSAVLPPPDSNEMLQATYDSADGRARISVFPGTTLAGPLTVEAIDPGQAAGPLQSPDNGFALRLGPDGTQFNNPVRLSLLIGAAAQRPDGSYVVPSIEVVTEDAAKVETLPDAQMEITENGLLIAHVYTNHFSDVVYRLKIGVEIGIDSPDDDAVFEVAETFATGMRVTNYNQIPLRAQAAEGNMAPVGPVTYNDSIVVIPAESSNFVGIGSCACAAVGLGYVEFDLAGDFELAGEINPSLIAFKKFVPVNCTLLETYITVTFDPELHTTNYLVDVFHTTDSTGFQRQQVFPGTRLALRWSAAATCGSFSRVTDTSTYSYEHEGCTGPEEAASRVQVEVKYTGDDGRVITRVYNMPARANEGGGPIAF